MARQRGASADAHSRFGTLARETIQQILEARGWSQTDAVEAWGIPQATLSEVLSGKNAAGAATLTAILEHEGWDPVSFFLQHARLSGRHMEVGDSLLREDFDRFVAAAGTDKRVRRALSMVERLNKLDLRDEVGDVVAALITTLERAAAHPSRSRRRR